MDISYNNYRKEISQELDYLGDIEWCTLNKLIEKFTEWKKQYSQPSRVFNKYCDGETVKYVKFDKLYIRKIDCGDGEYFYLYGDRQPDSSEQAVLDKQQAAQDEKNKAYKLAEFELLRKELGK